MNTLLLAENIIRLRHQKSITQEQLADFIGVTKASVSKWETKQSMPDILLLPQLAAFFDVTVDELLGYEPQLSREQIKTCYHSLAVAFANEPFASVMEQTRGLVKQYYSCYPFLLQISVLWLNHFMLAGEKADQMKILAEISELCDRILQNCKEMGVCNDAVCVRAMADLQGGKPAKVIEALEERRDFTHLGQEDTMLIQAYQMSGNVEKADEIAQISMYQKLLELISAGSFLMNIHIQDREYITKIVQRLDAMIFNFDLEHLNPNAAAVYHYQAALALCALGEPENVQQKEAILDHLEKFTLFSKAVLKDGVKLHGDSFFSRLDGWIERLDLGGEGVRDRKLVQRSAKEALENPVFQILREPKRIEALKNQFTEEE